MAEMDGSELELAPRATEVNFDGLVGPTHNYSALAAGNKAAEASQGNLSNPREAALQGLKKMKFLLDHGLVQGILPPHERPNIPFLRHLGFTGTDEEVLERAGREDSWLASTVSSAAAMWAANAATVAPSSDSEDGKVHFVPANLVANAHRSLESSTTRRVLQRVFAGGCFEHHSPLPLLAVFGDEGAANHLRLCRSHADPGVHLFVYGHREARGRDKEMARPAIHLARQTWDACAALIRLLCLNPEHVVLAQQNPAAIDAGVFHNDVIALSNESLLIVHEQAYVDTLLVLDELRRRREGDLDVVVVKAQDLSLDDAVKSYLFNSQLVSLPDGGMGLLVATDCDQIATAHRVVEQLKSDGKIRWAESFDLRESMDNGGGPACLRLRVVLTDAELAQIHPSSLLTESLYQDLVAWVNKHYRDRLSSEGLADPQLLQESRAALDELSSILRLGSIYPFQGTKD